MTPLPPTKKKKFINFMKKIGNINFMKKLKTDLIEVVRGVMYTFSFSSPTPYNIMSTVSRYMDYI